MSEGILRKLGSEKIEVFSAGLEPKGIHPLTVQVMEEEGIDMSSHRSKNLSEYMGKMHFSYVITVCGNADRNCPAVFPGAAFRLHWEFEDPAAFEGDEISRIMKFREIRDQIKKKIIWWLEQV